MEIFNLNSYLVGVLIGLAIVIPLLINIAICLLYKIKIIKITIFYTILTKKLHEINIKDTKFKLGIFPIDGLIKVLGYDRDEEISEIERINIDY